MSTNFRSLNTVDFITKLFKKHEGSSFRKELRNILGFQPKNISLYKTALTHRSVREGADENNERLEYLGDAVLSALIADYLFKRYPYREEGFLTEIRSRIVNREALNLLAKKIGVGNIVQFDNKNAHLQQVILGNTLEAIVGAIYLDKGYLRTRKFVIDKLITPNYDLEELVNSNSNFKSKIIEWAQREGKEVRFEILNVKKARNHKEFTAQVMVNNEAMGTGYGNSKKKAEQDAAFKTCEILNLFQ